MTNTVKVNEKALRESIRRKLREGNYDDFDRFMEEPDREKAISRVYLLLDLELNFKNVSANDPKDGSLPILLVSTDFSEPSTTVIPRGMDNLTPEESYFTPGEWGGGYTIDDMYALIDMMDESEAEAIISSIVNSHYNDIKDAFEGSAQPDENGDHWDMDMHAEKGLNDSGNVVRVDENTLARAVVEVARRIIAEGCGRRNRAGHRRSRK